MNSQQQRKTCAAQKQRTVSVTIKFGEGQALALRLVGRGLESVVPCYRHSGPTELKRHFPKYTEQSPHPVNPAHLL